MQSLIRFVNSFIPPGKWRISVGILLCVFIGSICVILRISNATAYLSDNPKACINCHVMYPQYETWFHSSHREKAVCNDCHVPHDSVVKKYMFKAEDGMRHASMYTFRKEPQVIKMHEAGQKVVQDNCIRCHNKLLDGTELIHGDYQSYIKGETKLCWECHREVPHGRVRSLAATPYYHVPQLKDSTPDSLVPFRNFLEKFIILKEENQHE